MRTPYGAWRASYTQGRWVVLSGPNSMIIMEPAPASASGLINAVWDQLLASASIAEISAALTGFGLDQMPNLAVLLWDGDSLVCLLRGEIKVVDADSMQELASGVGARTWYEADLEVARVEVLLDAVSPAEMLRLPLVVGAVEASAIFIDTEDALTVGASAPAVSDQPADLIESAPQIETETQQTAAPVVHEPVPDEVVPDEVVEAESLEPAEDSVDGEASETAEPLEEPVAEEAAEDEPVAEPEDSDVGPAVEAPVEEEPLAEADEPAAELAPEEAVEEAAAEADEPIVEPEPPLVDLSQADLPQFGGAPPPPFGAPQHSPDPELAVSPPRGGFAPPPMTPPTIVPPVIEPAPESAPPAAQQLAFEPTEVLGQRPGYAPGQEPGATGLAAQTFGQGSSGNAGPWGAEGFSAAADLPPAQPPAPTPPTTAEPIIAPVRKVDSSSDHDGETVFTTGIAATHKPSAGRNTDESLVLAAICALGHPNQPGSTECRVCGGAVDSHNPQLVNRPVLAIVATSAGEQLPLTGPILIGRAPSNTGNDLDAELMRVPSPNHDISRTHVRVAPHEWSIEVADLYSTNGTIVVPPGGQLIRLDPGQSIELAVGGQIDLGDGQVIDLLPPQ